MDHPRRTLPFALALAALLGTGCPGKPSLLVDLRTDFRPGIELASARTELTRVGDAGVVLREDRSLDASDDALRGVRVAERDDVVAGTWLVEVHLLSATGATVGSGRVLVTLGETTRVVTVVITRDCTGVVCDEDLTCVDAQCVDPRCSPEQPETCAARCGGDSECATSGPSCVVGRCLDGICFEAADDAMCGGSLCDPQEGCVGGPMDAGPTDSGPPDAGPVDAGPPPLTNVVEVAAGHRHTCARTGDGSVYCWGANASGEIGDGTTTTRDTPTLVEGLTDAVEIALGNQRSCARRSSGEVVCWGRGLWGQLGNGGTADAPRPVAVLGISDATKMSGGWDHTCVMRATGRPSCWGRGDEGQLLDASTVLTVPSPVRATAVDPPAGIAAGQIFGCSFTAAGSAQCAGNNFSGQLGDGTRTYASIPVTVMTTGVQQMSLGFNHSCAINTAGRLLCWGRNSEGQLGDGTTMERHSPVEVVGLSSVVEVSTFGNHTCARTATAVHCWGGNESGQVGDGTAIDRPDVTPVSGLVSPVQVAAGGDHTCAVLASGGLACWGRNLEGQLGDGTRTERRTPTLVTD